MHIPSEIRRTVQARARGLCEYCYSQVQFSPDSFEVEHVQPVSRGGSSSLDNLAFACSGCNGHKSSRLVAIDRVIDEVVPLYHPRRDRWQAHFFWSADCERIIGRTPTGRATVDALHLNREGVVNLRRVLFAINEHPPAPVND